MDNYWNKRYLDKATGWDIGYPSTPIKEYIDQLTDKTIDILIPGGGNAYEAEYLYDNGFLKVSVIDIAQIPLDNLKKRVPNFPNNQLINADFFEHSKQYDLIIEQTFFCAINPSLRKNYVRKAHSLLKSEGKLVGLLFNTKFEKAGPPFGGTELEYRGLFEDKFEIQDLSTAYNSIPPRDGVELFIKFLKKKKLN